MALGLVVAGVVAGVVASGGGSTKPVSLRANSIAVFDAKTGKAVGDVALGFSPDNVVAGGADIWVLDRNGQTATAIDPAALRVTHVVGLPLTPDGQWASGAVDWVGMPGSVEMIGPGSADATLLTLWRLPSLSVARPAGASECLAFVAGSDGMVWISQGQYLARLDGRNGTELSIHTLASTAEPHSNTTSCYGVRSTVEGLFAARDPDESVGPFDPQSGNLDPIYTGSGLSAQRNGGTGAIKTPWAVGFGALWIGGREEDPQTLRQRGELTRVDLDTGRTRFKAVIGAGVDDLAVDPASGVWVLDQGEESLRLIDPDSGSVIRILPLHHFPCCLPEQRTGGIAIDHGRIWVALQSP